MGYIDKEEIREKEKQREEEIKEKEIQFEIKNFNEGVIPFGSSDVRYAISVLKEYGVINAGDKLVELVEEYVDSTGEDLKNIDVCYLVLEHILQSVGNSINEHLGFDILNETNIYVYSNYLCSQYDCITEGAELIKEVIEKADRETLENLYEEEYVKDWLIEVGVLDG